MRVEYLDYNKIYELVRKLEDEVQKKFIPRRVYGIMRSGAIIAGMFATDLEIQMGIYDPKTKKYFPEEPCPKCDLIIDDVCATGGTLKEATRDGKIKSMVLVYDPSRNKTGYIPDFYALESSDVWILFPWDLIDFVRGEAKGYTRDKL